MIQWQVATHLLDQVDTMMQDAAVDFPQRENLVAESRRHLASLLTDFQGWNQIIIRQVTYALSETILHLKTVRHGLHQESTYRTTEASFTPIQATIQEIDAMEPERIVANMESDNANLSHNADTILSTAELAHATTPLLLDHGHSAHTAAMRLNKTCNNLHAVHATAHGISTLTGQLMNELTAQHEVLQTCAAQMQNAPSAMNHGALLVAQLAEGAHIH